MPTKLFSKSDVSVLFWNVDGLYSRIGNSRIIKFANADVHSTLVKHDIICLAETHCGPNDDVHLQGYQAFSNVRPKSSKAKKHSGGLVIYVKDSLRPGVKQLPVKNSEYMWIKLDKDFFNLECDIFLANVYLCPSNSSYASKTDNIIDLLESEIAELSKLGKILICGDFNARTNTAYDYCVSDDIDDVVKLPYNYIRDVPVPRNNLDNSPVNQHGESLLNLCKSTGIRIINGRLLGDSAGFYTCFSANGAPSVIDYMLISNEMLHTLTFLRVNDPTPYSIHNSLSLSMRTNPFRCPTKTTPKDSISSKFLWNTGDDIKLKLQIALPLTVEAITELTNSPPESTQESVDNFTDRITKVIKATSSKANIRTSRGATKRMKTKKKQTLVQWIMPKHEK